MPERLHPGVYVEEVPGGARPIEGAGTSTAVFVGIAEKGPIDEARFITNFTEFHRIYGGYISDNGIGKSYLAYSVYQFFQNGGRACYVVRVEANAKTAELKLNTDEMRHTMTIRAISPGAWGNNLRIAIGEGTTSEEGFNMYVFLGDELVETYEDLSMVNSSPFYVDRVTKRSLYIKTTSEDRPDNPQFIGKVDLFSGVDLQEVQNIRLQIDNYGPHIIDCSEGAREKQAVKANKIIYNINKAFEDDIEIPVASVKGNRIKIASPTTENDSQIEFTAPGGQDATYNIFGLQESSWVVEASEEPLLSQVFGLETANNIHNNLPSGGDTVPINIGLGTAPLVSIELTQGADPAASLFDVISAINSKLKLGEIAYTDGIHIILSTDQDIRIAQDNADRVFGGNFYSYVHLGSGDNNPARIQGDRDVNISGNGAIKLKIDTQPSFLVSLSTGDNAETIANKVNEAYQTVSKSRKRIAVNNRNRLVLTSIATGTSGRIMVSSHPGTDVATSVFGTAHQNTDNYLIPAETQLAARLVGKDLSGGIGAALGNDGGTARVLRISVGEKPVQFSITLPNDATVQQLFTDIFAPQTELNYHLLTSETTVHMIVASISGKPEIHFSIPLVGEEETAHILDTEAVTHAAYIGLFGDIPPFTGPENRHTSPIYTYHFGPQDNNPKKTVSAGEEIDSSKLLSLGGGNQDRSRQDMLANLTISGLRLLDRLTDISILVIPGWSGMDESTATRFINDGTAYCDKVRPAQARPLRDLFLVTNTPAEVTKPGDAKKYARKDIGYKSSGGYAAIYYPWIVVNDPIGTDSPTITVPPAGSIAGLYASIDGRRGVWKAPAGTEAGLAGVLGLADQVSDVKQDLLNPYGVNAIRSMPGAGIVSWGARTLATNPEWKYVPVRRTAIMIEVSIYEGIQWAVFEPNDEELWASLRLNIGSFMMTLFRQGAFQGNTPSKAFFVKCDAETTIQADIDAGVVNVFVGFAPLKPAEFVVVKISQKAGQSS